MKKIILGLYFITSFGVAEPLTNSKVKEVNQRFKQTFVGITTDGFTVTSMTLEHHKESRTVIIRVNNLGSKESQKFILNNWKSFRSMMFDLRERQCDSGVFWPSLLAFDNVDNVIGMYKYYSGANKEGRTLVYHCASD